jgi:hypothetical protein
VTETNIFQLSQPGTFADQLTRCCATGARALLSQAVEAEVAALLSCHADKLTDVSWLAASLVRGLVVDCAVEERVGAMPRGVMHLWPHVPSHLSRFLFHQTKRHGHNVAD